ncbi:MAG: PHP domain-containing protein [Bacillota bacterium]
MIIDLHVHTSALSPCSSLDPEEAVRTAKSMGLDGICFTEHCRIWPDTDLERLSAKWDFPVFCGMEVETREGHMLVFGLGEEIPEILGAGELREKVDRVDGAMIYAHPFRGFLLFGFTDLHMTIREASQRKVFQFVHAVETYSGKSGKKENKLALQVCDKLSVPGVGGSDAHSSGEVGKCVTVFKNRIRSTGELVAQLRRGEFTACYHNK